MKTTNVFFIIIILCEKIIFSCVEMLKYPSSPTMFANIFWVLNFSGVMFFGFTAFGYFFMKTYKKEVINVVEQFEKSYKCKIQIHNELKIIQFKFKKEKSLIPKNPQESAQSFQDLIKRDNVSQEFFISSDPPSDQKMN